VPLLIQTLIAQLILIVPEVEVARLGINLLCLIHAAVLGADRGEQGVGDIIIHQEEVCQGS